MSDLKTFEGHFSSAAHAFDILGIPSDVYADLFTTEMSQDSARVIAYLMAKTAELYGIKFEIETETETEDGPEQDGATVLQIWPDSHPDNDGKSASAYWANTIAAMDAREARLDAETSEQDERLALAEARNVELGRESARLRGVEYRAEEQPGYDERQALRAEIAAGKIKIDDAQRIRDEARLDLVD